jgi:signal transduction histidine kinase
MNKHMSLNQGGGIFAFRSLSLKQRLPLLICVLLLVIIITFSFISYFGVKRSALTMGRDRLQSLTEQLGTLFGKSAEGFINTTHTAVNQRPVKEYLQSGNPALLDSAKQAFEKMRQDTLSVFVQLLDVNRKPVFYSSKAGIEKRVNFDSLLKTAILPADTSKVGKLCVVNDSIYYPVITSVLGKSGAIGYAVRWRVMQTTQEALKQFSQLLGTDAAINVGNQDKSVWTDMIKSIQVPPVEKVSGKNSFDYSRNGTAVIAAVRAIPNTPWMVLLELSEAKVLEAATRFLSLLLATGAILIAAGIFIAWRMSRNITRPLNDLTAAASSIAAGNYLSKVKVDRTDETGRLAMAFNTMAAQVSQSQQDLEQKVRERTAQLERVNQELEAFSYSVSHDLRSPLRAINGYARVLNEDYSTELNEEARALIDKIISNARMMGQLIDDLIAFSRMGGQELARHHIDMNKLVQACVTNLLQAEPEDKYKIIIHKLPACEGDPNLIKQVWTNLIGNAIKYSSKKASPVIEIGFQQTGRVPAYFVRDNGVGFDMQHAQKLFGVFQRLHSQKKFEGTGIGLAFAKRIISKHSGDIWAEAAVDQGASFYFTVPLAEESANETETILSQNPKQLATYE